MFRWKTGWDSVRWEEMSEIEWRGKDKRQRKGWSFSLLHSPVRQPPALEVAPKASSPSMHGGFSCPQLWSKMWMLAEHESCARHVSGDKDFSVPFYLYLPQFSGLWKRRQENYIDDFKKKKRKLEGKWFSKFWGQESLELVTGHIQSEGSADYVLHCT